jgi:general secretion pathway protein G
MRRSGFSLVEIVIVVLILAILAAIAWPKVIGNFDTSNEVAAQRNLRMIRDAIDSYHLNWGRYPRGDIKPIDEQIGLYLHGSSFPECTVGNKNNLIRVVATGPFIISGTEGWAYNPRKGEFVINSDQTAPQTAEKYSDW